MSLLSCFELKFMPKDFDRQKKKQLKFHFVKSIKCASKFFSKSLGHIIDNGGYDIYCLFH